MNDAFCYERRVAFSDTDAMGVTHHANYLRFCEEARVAWMRARGLSGTHFPHSDRVLAVLHYQVWHFKPCTFDDQISVRLQVRRSGLKIHFQYAIYKGSDKGSERIAEAETLHIPVDGNLKAVRPSPLLISTLEKEAWTETWLSSS
ncbi:MAG: acyl-CoA thioesterase [Calothrix sp. SM1_5_4]|nr:acyl-CoA thioesterase [Calothrix sp. SM1_5_4]